MYTWRHKVGEKWMQARRKYLCASEIKDLVADYKRYEAGKCKLQELQQFAKIYGRKKTVEPDLESSGVMARGHFMEQFAIEEYGSRIGDSVHLWDDKLVTNGTLAFSPDAMDIEPVAGTEFTDTGDGYLESESGVRTSGLPQRIVEIKSYGQDAHYQRLAALASGIPLIERYQVAAAMVVCPWLDEADIVFYAPQCMEMFRAHYTRSTLNEEIEMVERITSTWVSFRRFMDTVPTYLTRYSEADIHQRYELEEMLDGSR